MALWSGRFTENVSEFTQRFGASLPVDKALYAQDIAGSKAHAKMLATVGVISEDDAQQIAAGLDRVKADIESGDFTFDINDEDIHMSVEKALTAEIGDAGARLHTGRSRNDQVATDTRLYAKQRATRSDARQCCAASCAHRSGRGEFRCYPAWLYPPAACATGPVLAPYACVCLDACARLSPFAGCTRCGRRLSAGRSCAGWDNVTRLIGR